MSDCVSVPEALRSCAPLDRRWRLHTITRKARALGTPAPVPTCSVALFAYFYFLNINRQPSRQPAGRRRYRESACGVTNVTLQWLGTGIESAE
jgi:hypothetical protein